MGVELTVFLRTNKNKMPKSKTFPTRTAWKANYFEKLESAMRNHSKFLLVNADNVASLQFEQIRDEVLANKVAAPARAGAIVPPGVDVIVPAQNTGMGPEKTSFFQALSIQTKIARGTIEIVTPVHLLKPGDKVGASEATLLNMLKISPFSYGLKVEACYDEGSVFEPEVLDITEDDIRARFMAGVNNVAAVSLNIGYPTVASAPHSIANGLKKLIAVACATEITFPAAEKSKAFLADPSAFVVEAAPAAAAAEAKVEEKKEESEEESDSDMGFDLFG